MEGPFRLPVLVCERASSSSVVIEIVGPEVSGPKTEIDGPAGASSSSSPGRTMDGTATGEEDCEMNF